MCLFYGGSSMDEWFAHWEAPVPVASSRKHSSISHTSRCDKGRSMMSADPGPSQTTSASLHAHDWKGKRLHALLEHITDVVALFDRTMHLLSINSAVERLLGYTPAGYAQLGAHFALLHPDDRKSGEDLLAALLQTPGASTTIQQRVKHQDGSYRWVEATLTNLLDDPQIGAVLLQMRDLSELKRLEAALQASEHRERTLSEERQQLVRREQQAQQEAELDMRDRAPLNCSLIGLVGPL